MDHKTSMISPPSLIWCVNSWYSFNLHIGIGLITSSSAHSSSWNYTMHIGNYRQCSWYKVWLTSFSPTIVWNFNNSWICQWCSKWRQNSNLIDCQYFVIVKTRFKLYSCLLCYYLHLQLKHINNSILFGQTLFQEH